jgi:hypothetical protein
VRDAQSVSNQQRRGFPGFYGGKRIHRLRVKIAIAERSMYCDWSILSVWWSKISLFGCIFWNIQTRVAPNGGMISNIAVNNVAVNAVRTTAT